MYARIDEKIFEEYPDVEIGFLIAEVSVKKSDPHTENLKNSLKSHVNTQGINATNFVLNPNIALWRKIYEEHFHVKAKTYRSSVESLLKRVTTGKSVWNINNIVDLYNCCSVLSFLPMGGYDLSKISGDITIRFAQEGESFLALGERRSVETKPNHVVYADDERVVCWLWNYKDSAKTCIDSKSKTVMFFIDSFDREKVENALQLLAENLEKIHCTPLQRGVLNKASREASIE